MPDFDELADKAKGYADDHDKQSDEALDKATNVVDDKTDNKYDNQVKSGEDKAENYLGVQDQDQQNQQDQGSK